MSHHINAQGGLCCGLLEVSGISNYAGGAKASVEALKDMCYALDFDDPVPFIIFTTAGRARKPVAYGENFKKAIETLGLGTVIKSEPRLSHTGNYVTVYIWQTNRPALRQYVQKALDCD